MSLSAAFDRLDDFCAVQRAQRGAITVEAVERLQEAVGITGAEREILLARLPALADDAAPAGVLLGILVGLLAADARS